MTQLLTDEFNDFFDAIQLNKTQRKRIESAISALSTFLKDKYELDDTQVFLQGSFSTDSAVRPPSSLKEAGEYDVDIVALCAQEDDSATDVLNELEKILKDNGTYKDKVETENRKIPCVRLRYADEDTARFHVDIVPAREQGDIIEIPRRDEGWEESNPQEYTTWVTEQGERYRKTVMMLKRWRDENQLPIKSIVLQVLVAECLSQASEDAINLAETLQALNSSLEHLEKPPEVFNPVLPNQIITDSWQKSDFKAFKDKLDEAVDIVSSALAEDDHDEAATLWQELLGDDFKFHTDKSVSLGETISGLGDTSHVKPLVFPYRPIPDAGIEIGASFYRERFKSLYRQKRRAWIQIKLPHFKYTIKSGAKVSSGGHLEFQLHVHGLKNQPYQIHWQVVNTGDEATTADDLRGTFFTSKDPEYHLESTKYEGTHWVECFVILNGVCVARSGRFYVTIVH